MHLSSSVSMFCLLTNHFLILYKRLNTSNGTSKNKTYKVRVS